MHAGNVGKLKPGWNFIIEELIRSGSKFDSRKSNEPTAIQIEESVALFD